jgi:hypothetical protein
LNFFTDSKIFSQDYPLYKALLYFNLPFDAIIKDLVAPKLIFEYDRTSHADEDHKLDKIIEEFERIRPNQNFNTPSIILMKVDIGTNPLESQDNSYIVGGYAS